MDVNGTRFHLLYTQPDWGACIAMDDGSGRTLATRWALIDDEDQPPLEWSGNPTDGYLQLARQAPLFRSATETGQLDINRRRGADRDRYGHWYWIDPQQGGIRFLANDERESVKFWTWADQPVDCDPVPDGGDFVDAVEPMPDRIDLRGLAVTTRHYLVVGNVTQNGILVFDLHRGGPPLLLQWPEDTPFSPWDMAATPDGGVLITGVRKLVL